jgi:hypothetical protein
MTMELWALVALLTLTSALIVWALVTGEPARMPRHEDRTDTDD